MSLTGTAIPLGTTITQESIYLDSAPDLYIQDIRGAYLFNPDADGYYWGCSGSVTYPVYKLGCYSGVSFGDDVTMNDIVCDATGVEGVIQKRGSLHLTFTFQSLLPVSILAHLLRFGTPLNDPTDGAEKAGIGDVTRKNLYWKAYFVKVYDEDTGDFFAVTIHKGQFVGAWEMAMPFGDRWNVPITLRGFADSSKPVGQRFATVIRVDPPVVV
jgi:hypothetical protein